MKICLLSDNYFVRKIVTAMVANFFWESGNSAGEYSVWQFSTFKNGEKKFQPGCHYIAVYFMGNHCEPLLAHESLKHEAKATGASLDIIPVHGCSPALIEGSINRAYRAICNLTQFRQYKASDFYKHLKIAA